MGTSFWDRLSQLIGATFGSTARRPAETELRETARQLRLERALLEAVLQQAPVGISILGAGLQAPIMINARAEELLGHGVGVDRPGESRFASYGALHLDGRRYMPAEYPGVRALQRGEVVRAEEMGAYNVRTGEVRRMHVSSAPVHDAEGAVQAAVTIFVDVEDARCAREKLLEAQRFTAALLDLGDRLRGTSLVPDVTRSAAEVIGLALGASRAGFAALDENGIVVAVEADWIGSSRTRDAARDPFAPCSDLWSTTIDGYPLTVSDVRTDPRTAGHAAAFHEIGVRAMMGMLVRERDRTTMLLFVHDHVPRAWSEAERAFLRGVIDRVEVAIARIRAEEQQRLLNRELSHRMKNLLAMVQAITVQTMRSVTDVAEARDVLSGRLVALSTTHDLLLGGCVSSTRLDAVVRDALQVHQDHPERFACSGPDVEIGADPAMALALSLHELATNAAKYGALTTVGGRVEIGWEIVEGGAEPSLRLTWLESGGPPVQTPTRKGFGSRFLERALAGQVGGEMALAYPDTGVTFVLIAPLSAFQRT